MTGKTYLSDTELAKILCRSYKWFLTHRPELEARGFPAKDPIIGLTLSADVDAWLVRQRKVSDDVVVTVQSDDTTMRINTDAL